jgi:hypothetical protein
MYWNPADSAYDTNQVNADSKLDSDLWEDRYD